MCCAFGAIALAGGAFGPARAAESAGHREDARAGVAAAAVGELLDAPHLLASPDEQHYAHETFERLASLTPNDALRERFSLVRRAFDPRDAHFDRALALGRYGDLLRSLLDALPPGRRRVFLAGELAQSIAYNARVLREPAADGYRGALANISDADATAPGLQELRAQLGKLDAEDWDDSARLALRAVAAIAGSATAVPFPPSPAIWTILVRSRVPSGRAAPHLALDVVWFDGHHQTFAAYPDGDDFSKNADRMICERDREPSAGTLHATPLVVPLERGYDALATSFERSCDAFTAQPPPYVVADAGDDRFIAATLTAAGLDPKLALGTTK
jgi:hypothetical protein